MDIDIEKSKYAQKAMGLFLEGYNCSQSVFLAFEDLYKMDRETAQRVSSSFGGGMGRLREVCGAVTGAFLILGMAYPATDPGDKAAKATRERDRKLKALYDALYK